MQCRDNTLHIVWMFKKMGVCLNVPNYDIPYTKISDYFMLNRLNISTFLHRGREITFQIAISIDIMLTCIS